MSIEVSETTAETLIARLINANEGFTNEVLADAICDQDADEETDGDEAAPQIRSVRTFEEAAVMTMNKGLVITLTNGQSIYLTIQVQ